MAVDVLAGPRAAARVRAFPLSAVAVIASLIVTSAVVRFLMALAHPTPIFFADEYIYSTLAYELATTGAPTIRGGSASFPALLEPLLTAPFWLFGDPAVALRLTQGLNAIAMSVAAVPVYLLARRLDLGKAFGLAAAASALLVPDFFYVGFILAEPIAYPLALGAVYAGVCALTQPSVQRQLAFLGLAGLASFARIQFVILPLAFVLAALVARADVRKLRLTFGAFLVGVAVVAAKGVGYYSGIADFALEPRELAHWLAVDSMLVAYAAGWLVVPGALVALARPKPGVERAFAALTAFTGAGLMAEAVLYAANADLGPGGRFQERYLFTLLPLLVLAFGLSLRRGARARAAIALLAATLVGVSARFPLSGWTDDHGRQDSPLLMGVYRLSELVGHETASLVVAAIAAALAAGAVAIAFRPQLALPALGVVGTLLALVGFGAWTLDARFSQRARETYLPHDASWIDSARVGPVTLVNTPGSGRELALEQMFWNRSVKRLVRLRNAGFPDKFAAPRVRIGGDGALLLRGRPVRDAVVFSEYAVTAELRGARSVAATKLFELWKPEGKPRLRLLAGGRYFDKWLANSGYVRIWNAPGTLRLRLVLPPRAPRSALSFRARGVRRTVVVEPGSSRVVEFAVPRGVWTLRWKGPQNALPDGRPVSVQAPMLSLEQSPGVQPAAAAADT